MANDTTAPKHVMDATKVKTAISNAQAEVKNMIDAEIKARSFNGLKALAGVDTALTKALSRLDDAAKRALPRAKKAKKAK